MHFARNALLATLGALLGAVALPVAVLAASQPLIEGVSVRHVTGNDAILEATINPEGLSSFGADYPFQMVTNTSEYIPEIVCAAPCHPAGMDVPAP